MSDFLNAQKLFRSGYVSVFYTISIFIAFIGLSFWVSFQWKEGSIVIAGVIGAWLIELMVSRVFLPRKVKRLYSQQKDFASAFVYKWDNIFIEAEGVSGRSKREWKNYLKYSEDKNMFLLYHNDIMFEMIPKRWFSDQTQMNEFRELAKQAGSSENTKS